MVGERVSDLHIGMVRECLEWHLAFHLAHSRTKLRRVRRCYIYVCIYFNFVSLFHFSWQ